MPAVVKDETKSCCVSWGNCRNCLSQSSGCSPLPLLTWTLSNFHLLLYRLLDKGYSGKKGKSKLGSKNQVYRGGAATKRCRAAHYMYVCTLKASANMGLKSEPMTLCSRVLRRRKTCKDSSQETNEQKKKPKTHTASRIFSKFGCSGGPRSASQGQPQGERGSGRAH